MKVDAIDQITAPAHWRVLDFISDLHLQPGDPQTLAAWRSYMQATQADAVFILGDLFEVWVGDDAAAPGPTADTAEGRFLSTCRDVLAAASACRDVRFMCGNRDFLVGPAFLGSCGLGQLSDPCTLAFGEQRWLLSHGDALCLDDTDYQRFRAMVRSAQWQSDFLAQPLEQRQALARGMRAQSEQHKRAHPEPAIVDAQAAERWLRDAGAQVLIHGHTHQPADHRLADGLSRMVLSDWDLQAQPPRAQVLRLSLDHAGRSATTQRLTPDAACRA